MTSITIHEGITELGVSAFAECPNIETVYFNAIDCKNHTSLKGIFRSCSSLKDVFIGEKVTNIPASIFYKCESLSSITIPNSVKTISRSAFRDCTNLETIVLGESLESIAEQAFDDCEKLVSITSLNPTPPICTESSNVFPNIIYDTATLSISSNCINDYTTADVWKNFKNINKISGINNQNINTSNNPTEIERYNINGVQIKEPIKGINIIRFSDGTTRKEIIK